MTTLVIILLSIVGLVLISIACTLSNIHSEIETLSKEIIKEIIKQSILKETRSNPKYRIVSKIEGKRTINGDWVLHKEELN